MNFVTFYISTQNTIFMTILKKGFTPTIDDILACPEFSQLTAEQAQAVLETFESLCEIIANQHKHLFHNGDSETFKIAA
jgi:uncharacterized protein YfbU (UPF0304 family)